LFDAVAEQLEEALAEPLDDGLFPWAGRVLRGLSGHRIASQASVSGLGVP